MSVSESVVPRLLRDLLHYGHDGARTSGR